MSIHLVAKELYRAQQVVQQLEDELQQAPPAGRDVIKEKLRLARAEWRQIKNMLDGAKAEPICRQPGTPFKGRR